MTVSKRPKFFIKGLVKPHRHMNNHGVKSASYCKKIANIFTLIHDYKFDSLKEHITVRGVILGPDFFILPESAPKNKTKY